MTVTERILTIAMVVLGTVTTRFLPFALLPGGEKTAGCHRPAGSGAAGGGHGLFGHLLPEGRFVHRLLWSAGADLFGLCGGGSPSETEYGAELGGWYGAAYGFGAVLLCVICYPLSLLSPSISLL